MGKDNNKIGQEQSSRNAEDAPIVLRGDQFDIQLSQYLVSEKFRPVSDFLKEQSRPAKFTGLSYRVANSWQNAGLIEPRRDSGQGWRKYSLLELMLVLLLVELRKFGLGIEQLKRTRSTLYEQQDGRFSESVSPLFEYYVFLTMSNIPVFAICQKDGSANVGTYQEITISREMSAIGDHISINLNQFMQALFPKKDLSPNIGISEQLSAKEFEILMLIRSEQFNWVRIHKSDGSTSLIEVQENIQVGEIEEKLKTGNFQSIELQQTDGKVISVKRTLKVKK